jgi:hypothetical protein
VGGDFFADFFELCGGGDHEVKFTPTGVRPVCDATTTAGRTQCCAKFTRRSQRRGSGPTHRGEAAMNGARSCVLASLTAVE